MTVRRAWAQARQARRARFGCPPWATVPEACVILLSGVTARTALPVALVVGTLLSAVNQGAVIVAGDASAGVWLRVAFNYAVPFVVSSIGFLGAGRLATTDPSSVGEDSRGPDDDPPTG